jgi:hypothetical protein
VETVTLKLDRRHVELLEAQADASGRSKAAVVRDLIERHLGSRNRRSLHDRAVGLCGSVSAGRTASTRSLRGYGRD